MAWRYIGGASGAALGYIYGNVPGAARGASLGFSYGLAKDKFNENYQMARTKYPPTPGSSKRKRRGSYASSTSSYNPRKKGRNGRTKRTPFRSNVQQQKRKGNVTSNPSAVSFVSKPKRNIGSKYVKTTRLFKKKVQSALQPTKPHGTYKWINTYRAGPPESAVNYQTVYDFGTHFTPVEFADAIATLWHGATPIQQPTATTCAAQMANFHLLKFRSLKCYSTYEIKNMSQRTYTLKLYTCAPKSNRNDLTAYTDWANGMVVDAASTTNETNPLTNTPFTLHATPQILPTFNAKWSTEYKRVTLEPGETYVHTIDGGKYVDYDFAKMRDAVSSGTAITTHSVTKHSRSFFMTYHLDLVVTSAGDGGRIPSSGSGIGGLCIEEVRTYSMDLPDLIGFKFGASTAAGVSQTLTHRKHVYATKVWTTSSSGTVQDVLEDSPGAIINPVD